MYPVLSGQNIYSKFKPESKSSDLRVSAERHERDLQVVSNRLQPASTQPKQRLDNEIGVEMETNSILSAIWETVVLLALVAYSWAHAIFISCLPTSWIAKDVRGEIALITGAGSGLGRGVALRLAKLGCNLVLWDIDETSNQATGDETRKLGVRAHTYKVDLCNREEIYKVAAKVKSDVGRVDILINNAGIVTGRDYMKCPDSLIQKTMEVNIMAHFWTVKAFLPGMMERNHGHVVTIASSAGYFGVRSLSDYNASKFAAVGFDESLRYELNQEGTDGINTTVVAPYFINTGMFDGVKLKFQKLLPMVEPDYACDRIVDAILRNQQVLMFPRTLYFMLALKGFLPCETQTLLNKACGLMNTMDDFKGRAKKE
ncbi:hypothetical protein ScPMuIL_007720 [Solemya velum]